MTHDFEIFKALGNKTRMRIVRELLNGEMCACDITPCTGKKTIKHIDSAIKIEQSRNHI